MSPAAEQGLVASSTTSNQGFETASSLRLYQPPALRTSIPTELGIAIDEVSEKQAVVLKTGLGTTPIHLNNLEPEKMKTPTTE